MAAPSTPPRPEKRPVTRTFHGREFVDNYEWLRDKDDPEVLDHLRAEDAFTKAQTADLADLEEQIFQEIKSRTKETDMSVPTRAGSWWYFSRTEEGKSYGKSCRVPATPGDWQAPEVTEEPLPGEEVILDANELAEPHDYFALGAAALSKDHNFVAYSTDTSGDERYDLRIKDLRTGQLLADAIDNIAAGATWIGNEWLLYQRVDEAWRPDSVWLHRVGSDTAEDTRIFYEPDQAFWVGVGVTRSEKYLLIAAGSTVTSECWFVETTNPRAPLTCVRKRQRGVEYDIDHAVVDGKDMWLVNHNADGPNFALGAIEVGSFEEFSELKPVVPHRDDVRVEWMDCFATHLVLGYRRGGIGRISLAQLPQSAEQADQTEPESSINFVDIEFDEELYTAAPAGNAEWEAPVLRYGYGSFTTPSQLWQLDLRTGERTLLKAQEVLGDFTAEDYVAERRWVPAADGTEIPVSIVRRRDLDLANPVPILLYAYGSYEASMDPGFSVARLSLLDRGMSFVIAHVRGGGEMGRSWWERGRTMSKKNTFTDYVAVADYLIAEGLTTPDQLVAVGGSAGGMLMGVVANTAGDRFAGIQASVPFVDCLTTMLKPELPLTVGEWDEWGDPYHDPTVYDYMASYSPYENISADIKYPKILAITSLNDIRVLYVEPAKWVAKLRDVAGDGKLVQDHPDQFLMKIDMVGGHGGKSGRYNKWRDTAFEYAWLLRTSSAA